MRVEGNEWKRDGIGLGNDLRPGSNPGPPHSRCLSRLNHKQGQRKPYWPKPKMHVL